MKGREAVNKSGKCPGNDELDKIPEKQPTVHPVDIVKSYSLTDDRNLMANPLAVST